jgi:hypothetical protein
MSDSKNFLFVHVQKAAGSSIRRLLEPHAVRPTRTAWNKVSSRLGLQRDNRRFCFRRHARIARLGSFEAYVDHEIRRDKISQLAMLCDSAGRLRVDFVGRFETLSDDFEQVRTRLGIEGRLVPFNVSHHDPYQSYYTPRTRQRVEWHWAAEIALFGYDFDGVRSDALR